MAGRDPFRPQLDFPDLVAELITQLRLRGQVGLLNFSDEVVPAFLVGSRGINFAGDLPIFTSASVFAGSLALPVGNTVVADTGALPAGDYDVMANLGAIGTIGVNADGYAVQHRNAANTATLATLIILIMTGTHLSIETRLPLMGYRLGLNERIRAISPSVNMTAGGVTAVIFAQIRPTP